ncbi:MAG: thioesterase [Firmicutes bacterium]|nr:thioesterase [Bacillota bacterium]MCL1953132.1 thioesterase [Bacillota bacterium]
MYSHQTHVVISNTTVDRQMSVMGLISFLGDCEQLQIENDSCLYDFLKSNNLGMYLISRYLQILSMPKYGDKIDATTSIYDLRTSYGYRNTYVYDSKGNVLVKTYAMGAFVDLNTNRIARVPKSFLEDYCLEQQLEMDYPSRKIDCLGDKVDCCAIPVTYSYLDIYGHVNNARYVSLACDVVDNVKAIKSIRVEYKNAAKLGDILHISKFVNYDKQVVQLANSNGILYSVVELCW